MLKQTFAFFAFQVTKLAFFEHFRHPEKTGTK